MIFTRFGLPVTEIVQYHAKERMVDLFVRDGDKEYPLTRHIGELKADGGLQEIMEAIKAL